MVSILPVSPIFVVSILSVPCAFSLCSSLHRLNFNFVSIYSSFHPSVAHTFAFSILAKCLYFYCLYPFIVPILSSSPSFHLFYCLLPFHRTHTFIDSIFSSSPYFNCVHLFIVPILSSSASFHRSHPFIVSILSSSLTFHSLYPFISPSFFIVTILALSPSFHNRHPFIVSIFSSSFSYLRLYYETLKCKTWHCMMKLYCK